MKEKIKYETDPIPDGTPVRVLLSGFKRSWVTEYRGPLGPNGSRVYRVLVGKKPRMYAEFREDQLEILGEETAVS